MTTTFFDTQTISVQKYYTPLLSMTPEMRKKMHAERLKKARNFSDTKEPTHISEYDKILYIDNF